MNAGGGMCHHAATCTEKIILIRGVEEESMKCKAIVPNNTREI